MSGWTIQSVSEIPGKPSSFKTSSIGTKHLLGRLEGLLMGAHFWKWKIRACRVSPKWAAWMRWETVSFSDAQILQVLLAVLLQVALSASFPCATSQLSQP